MEFLCPLEGSEYDRSGKKKVTKTIQPGITAQQLRYLDVLFIEPVEVHLANIPEFDEVGMPDRILICNPASYVIQKILIRDQERTRSKMKKDAYYIYEVSIVFRDELDWIGMLAKSVFAKIQVKWRDRFLEEIKKMFASAESEGCIDAVEVHNEFHAGSGLELNGEMVFRSIEKLRKVLTPI